MSEVAFSVSKLKALNCTDLPVLSQHDYQPFLEHSSKPSFKQLIT